MLAWSAPLGRLLQRRGPALVLYGLAVTLVPVGAVSLHREGERTVPTMELPTPIEVAAPAARAPDERLRALSGVWQRYETGTEGERVRFYYFHGDGTGLYRYGRVGLTNTHGFDYDLVGESTLVLDFRKSGEHHEVRYSLREGSGDEPDWLELHDDPREPGNGRYFRESDETIRRAAPATSTAGPPPAGHMWIDLQRYATGGRGFSMYQLRPAGIDGRGVGWFHRGDFDDWATEALTYRIVGDRIELTFSLAERREVSTFTIHTDDEGARWLELADDPRDFWHPHRYVDMGPSFGLALAPLMAERP